MFRKKLVVRAMYLACSLAVTSAMVPQLTYAQQSAGSLSGTAASGDKVMVENKAINITREATVGESGTFQFNQLPPGAYTVTLTRANGQKETRLIQVAAGEGAFASFGTALAAVQVSGVATRTIDVASPTPSFSISAESIERTPVAQNVTAVTLLAPTAIQGDSRIGGTAVRAANLPSLGGASVAENAYYINGFNVTNIVKGIAFNEVPFPGIGNLQVLTGGYGAEYGRSLGGVVSVTTKRGTDEWKGGVSLAWEPDALRGGGGGLIKGGNDIYYKKNTATGAWEQTVRPGKRELLEANFYAGGPLIKDTLYGFALVQAANLKREVYNQNTQFESTTNTPQYLIKLDWNITKNHLLELTAFNDESVEKANNYFSATDYGKERSGFIGLDQYKTGGQNTILKWTGFLTSDLTVSALAGVGNYSRSNQIAASGCPAVYDGRPPRTQLEYLGCWSEANLTVDNPNARDKRTAYRLDLEYVLGNHTIRAGLDNEVYETVDGTQYSGGFYDRLFTLAPGASISGTGYTNTTGAPLDYVRERVLFNGGKFKTKNSAWYIEDTYQVTKDLVANLGLRNERFENQNDSGQPFIKVQNTWAPRAGLAWNVRGDGQTKLFTNLGRYYIPVYANTNVRLSGAETFYTDYFAFDGTFSTDGRSVPGKGAQLGNRVVTSDGSPKDPRTVVDPNIKPMYQEEFVLGFQQALSDGWAVGVKWTNRRLKSAIDDICEGALAEEWALANGYTATQAGNIGSTIAGCFLYNPGGDLTANVDLDGTGVLTPVRIPASALQMPKPSRKYNALEFTAERQWDKKWSVSASYVLSWNKGNTEGYVKSDNGQDDAGITQDFDHPGLMEGSYGFLPNDRRHAFKLTGSVQATDEWLFGASFVAASGRPKNCFGNYPDTAGTNPDGSTYPAGPLARDDSDLYGASTFYCNGRLVDRGGYGRLPWTFETSVRAVYTPKWAKGLTLGVSVLNLFNERGIRAIDEAGELDSVGSANPTYQRPFTGSTQRPRTVRLSAAYEF